MVYSQSQCGFFPVFIPQSGLHFRALQLLLMIVFYASVSLELTNKVNVNKLPNVYSQKPQIDQRDSFPGNNFSFISNPLVHGRPSFARYPPADIRNMFCNEILSLVSVE